MSAVQIIQTKAETYSTLGRYFYVTLTSGNHSASVVVAPNHLQVVVHNASNRAWRGMGRRCENLEAALAAYKSDAVRDMIRVAVELSKESLTSV